VRLSPLGTAVTVWPIVPAPDDRWWLWSNRWNTNWQGKPKYFEKTCPSATLSTTNPTCPDAGSNPGRRCRKPATNRLSYGTASVIESEFAYWRVESIVGPLGTSATEWPIVAVPGDYDDGEIWRNKDWQRKPKYSEKTCPSATLSATNSTCQTRASTRATAVGSQRLTAWAMTRPQL
jgi:hypothetical protein